jgi:hypothetical protein
MGTDRFVFRVFRDLVPCSGDGGAEGAFSDGA